LGNTHDEEKIVEMAITESVQWGRMHFSLRKEALIFLKREY
jgi:hypothetical protein